MKFHYDGGTREIRDENGLARAQVVTREDWAVMIHRFNCHDELVRTLKNVRELQDSADYPHVKAEMTWAMCNKAIVAARGER